MNPLRYTDDADRAYGAAGMAIGLVAFDGEEYITSIDIDREPDDILELRDDFYFSGNPEFSAKSAWNRMLHNYNLSLVMLISNIMCRDRVQNRLTVSSDLHKLIRSTAFDEGRDACGLDQDEFDRLFEKDFNYLNRLFSHYGVKNVADDFARSISSRRFLSHMEILDSLQALQML
ncbi:MAG: hypothetical protein HDS56_01060 [Barnesiella sp.]|nr:hypothetical protein [Barnesiella sp.]MDE5828636.1 hypothetical protein [Duncaniella sp.]